MSLWLYEYHHLIFIGVKVLHFVWNGNTQHRDGRILWPGEIDHKLYLPSLNSKSSTVMGMEFNWTNAISLNQWHWLSWPLVQYSLLALTPPVCSIIIQWPLNMIYLSKDDCFSNGSFVLSQQQKHLNLEIGAKIFESWAQSKKLPTKHFLLNLKFWEYYSVSPRRDCILEGSIVSLLRLTD